MAKHYVYELYAQDGSIAYVGKGSGRRLQVQRRKFGLHGRIVREFDTASAAYRYEVKRIAECKPSLNKCAGGNGNRNKRAISVRDPIYKLCSALGSRVVAARILMNYFWMIEPSKVEQIRRVAYG